MAHTVKETDRNYVASPPHMSLVGGSLATDKRGAKKVPLTADRSGSTRRYSARAHVKGSSHVQLAGRPRAIIAHSGSSLAVR